MGGGGAHEAPLLCGELLAVNGFWGKEDIFSYVVTDKLFLVTPQSC